MKRSRLPSGPWTIHLRKNAVRTKAAWYRWEFLRRNSEYRKDYEQFVTRFADFIDENNTWYSGAVVFWTARDKTYYFSKVSPALDRICEKWQISDLYPPHWKFSKVDGKRKFENGTLSLPTEPSLDFEKFKKLYNMGFTGVGGSARRLSKHLVIEFDLTWPMKDMIAYAKRALSHGQSGYLEELEQLGVSPRKSRRRLVDYDLHLKAWDLRKRGKLIEEIASRLFPSEVHDLGKSAVLQKVRDHIDAAEKLIGGQYKEIK